MPEILDTLKPLLTRIGNFFGLFDLSFFVSGSVAVAASIAWLRLRGAELPYKPQGWLRVLSVILACYVAGLVCFALGRWIRKATTESNRLNEFDRFFIEVLEAHGLASEEIFKEYLARTDLRGPRRLYIRLWAQVRQVEQFAPSLDILNRNWVMTATYDGLSVAIAIWAILVLLWGFGIGISPTLGPKYGIPTFLGLFLSSYFCLREANRYSRNQIEELVATIAEHRLISPVKKHL